MPWRSPLVVGSFVVLGLVLATAVVFVLGVGPFSPGSTPSPSGAATHTGTPPQNGETTAPATAELTPRQTQAPTQTSGPTSPPGSPATPTEALLRHIPEPLRASCTPGAPVAPVLATVTCTTDDGQISVTYSSYPDQASMTAVYEANVIVAGIENNSGRCYNTSDDGTFIATTSRWPSENGYTVNDEPQGRYLCHQPGVPTISWTHDRLYILGVASTASGDADRLVAFWVNESGPVH